MRNETLSSMARNIPSSQASIRRCPPKYTTRGSKNVNLCLRYAFTTYHMNYSFMINMSPAQTYLGPNTSMKVQQFYFSNFLFAFLYALNHPEMQKNN